MTRITNFWIVLDDAITLSPAGATVDTQKVLAQTIPSLNAVFSQPGQTFVSAYVRGEYHELTVLRENLRHLQDRHPGQFYIAGAWDFDTGTPVGGAGSPWFRTPPELLDYMPNGTFEDRHFVAGQAKRQFV